jgi:hypothetical protein
VVDDTPDASLVVLDDAALGFRDHPELWPAALANERRSCAHGSCLKMARPLAQGKLWEHLLPELFGPPDRWWQRWMTCA